MQLSIFRALRMHPRLRHGLALMLIASISTFSHGVESTVSAPDESELWDQQSQGTTSVNGVGPVQYSMGYRSEGFDHFATEIKVSWRHGQPPAKQQQVLYEGIHDKPPAKIWGAGRHLCLAMQTCARQSDHCRWHVLAHRFQSQSQSFVEVKNTGQVCRLPR